MELKLSNQTFFFKNTHRFFTKKKTIEKQKNRRRRKQSKIGHGSKRNASDNCQPEYWKIIQLAIKEIFLIHNLIVVVVTRLIILKCYFSWKTQ